jgi:hypothetical protein
MRFRRRSWLTPLDRHIDERHFMSSTQAAVVLGASGSVGNALIKELIRNGSFKTIRYHAQRIANARPGREDDADVSAPIAGFDLVRNFGPSLARCRRLVGERVRDVGRDEWHGDTDPYEARGSALRTAELVCRAGADARDDRVAARHAARIVHDRDAARIGELCRYRDVSGARGSVLARARHGIVAESIREFLRGAERTIRPPRTRGADGAGAICVG